MHNAIKLIGLAIWALLTPSAWADTRSLIIIHTNDLHGHMQQTAEFAGAARIAALVDQTRQQQPGVLVLDAGDSISGTPVSTLFKGVPIFAILNRVGYNAGALGNHEFDHGSRQIALFRETAGYPLLSANARTTDGALLADEASLIMQVNGIRIAVIGLITAETPDLITPVGNSNLAFDSPEAILRTQVEDLDPLVDLVLVLSHLGHEEEQRLAAAIDNIDIIIGGHSHTAVAPPVKINDTYVVQAGFYGAYVGYLELGVDTENHKLASFNGKLIAAEELPSPDAFVADMVATWEQAVETIVDVDISRVDRDYSRADLQPIIEAILARHTGADFGFYNSGGIRDRIRRGSITIRDIWSIEPFGNSVVTVTARGSDIKKMLSMEGEPHWRLPELADNMTYRVATNSFVAAQASKKAPTHFTVKDSQRLVRDVLVEYIETYGLRIDQASR